MTHQFTLPKVSEIAPQTGKPAGPQRPPAGR
jgi:hypothetical protein